MLRNRFKIHPFQNFEKFNFRRQIREFTKNRISTFFKEENFKPILKILFYRKSFKIRGSHWAIWKMWSQRIPALDRSQSCGSWQNKRVERLGRINFPVPTNQNYTGINTYLFFVTSLTAFYNVFVYLRTKPTTVENIVQENQQIGLFHSTASLLHKSIHQIASTLYRYSRDRRPN